MAIVIEMPEDYTEFRRNEATRESAKVAGKSGIYVFYDRLGRPLYIGKSKDLSRRLKEHLGSGRSEFSHLIESIRIYLEPNQCYVDIYETYLINELKPPFNYDKAHYAERYLIVADRLSEVEVRLREIEEEIRELEHEERPDDMDGLGDCLLAGSEVRRLVRERARLNGEATRLRRRSERGVA
ncbi:nucleotide excision repair endonuclease [Paenibacillus sp. FSL L8-0436]|uniref:nucleotide excision repair endonuclease n=1 Tax=Paenibacillus sp. FSL L8-0436 TaxID=2954686 RepID=UPI003158B028